MTPEPHAHASESPGDAPVHLVAGCGYLGRALADLLHARGLRVVALTRSQRSAEALAAERPYPAHACDIARADALAGCVARVRPDLRGAAVLHCASSNRGDASAYRRVYLEGMRNLLDIVAPRLLVFTSSTSVYAQSSGETVAETDEANPITQTSQILRQTEEIALAQGGRVARLSGIYGPGRSVFLRRLLDGVATIEGAGTRIVNQIHRDDAAAALALLATPDAPPGIYNVTDDQPIPQGTLYAELSRLLSLPLPPSAPPDPGRKRGLSNKAISNAKLRALGWAPAHPTFLGTVPDLIRALRSEI